MILFVKHEGRFGQVVYRVLSQEETKAGIEYTCGLELYGENGPFALGKGFVGVTRQTRTENEFVELNFKKMIIPDETLTPTQEALSLMIEAIKKVKTLPLADQDQIVCVIDEGEYRMRPESNGGLGQDPERVIAWMKSPEAWGWKWSDRKNRSTG